MTNMFTLNPWSPISTAPRDGTVIDLWVDGKRKTNCRYHNPMNTFKSSGWMDSDEYLFEGEATHWMPKPPAPAPLTLAEYHKEVK